MTIRIPFIERIFILFLIIAFGPVQASELGGWGKSSPGDEIDDIWSDFQEARPDLVPDAWLVDRLVGASGDEIMLRSSNGAMLRWVTLEQIRHLDSVRLSLQAVAELKVDFYITRGDKPNAAAGKRAGVNTMFVNFAMMDLIENDRDQWAALMGHEIAHLKLGHLDKRAKRSLPLSILKIVTQGVLAADPLASSAGGLLVDGIGMKFSRDAERESDYMGVVWAVEASFDPYAAARLHSQMSQRSSGFSIPFLSSHPTGPERIKRLTELADRLSH